MSAAMTRKHFRELAALVSFLRRQHPEEYHNALFEHLIDDLANYCRRYNERFDRAMFVDACEPYHHPLCNSRKEYRM